MMTKKKPTISDVAKLADVSPAAVSMALSGKGRISTWTAQRINDAIGQLGYVRNNNAAALRSGKTGLIAVMMHGLERRFNLEVLQGLNAKIDCDNKVAFILIYETALDLDNRLNIALNYNVDGIIIVSPTHISKSIELRLQNQTIPFATIAFTNQLSDHNHFCVDAASVSALATQYLIDNGHIHIAFVGGNMKSYDRAEKLAGYFSTLRKNNIKDDRSLILPEGDNLQNTAEGVEKLISSHPWLTAILCYDELATKGTVTGINNRGRTVGKDNYIERDISLIALEKIDEAEYGAPSITCVDYSAFQMGWNAAHILIQKIDNHQEIITLSHPGPTLILRNSA